MMQQEEPKLTPQQLKLLGGKPLEPQGRIVLLDDPDRCYRIEEGEVPICTARMRDGVPLYNRREVCTFSAGDFIFPSTALRPDSLPAKPKVLEQERGQNLSLVLFMLVDKGVKLTVMDRQALFGNRELAAHARFGAENWVRKITDALPKNLDLPEISVVRLSADGEPYTADEDICVKADSDEIVWMKFSRAPGEKEQASTALANYRGITIAEGDDLSHIPLPLFGRDMTIAHTGAVVTPVTTEAIFGSESGARAIDEFNHLSGVFLYLDALRTERRQKWSTKHAREVERQNLDAMLQNFENAFQGKEDIAPHSMVVDRTSVANNLLLELCRVTKTEFKVIAPEILDAVNPETLDGLERLLNLGGFDKRKITLDGEWHKRNSWTILAFYRDEETSRTIPLLLHYDAGAKRYRCYDPTNNAWSDLSASMIKGISDQALTVYRRLDANITNIKDFMIQALRFSHVDARRIAFTAIILGAITLVHPVILGKLISKALPTFDFTLLNSYLLALFAATLGIFAANFFNSIAMLRIESSLSINMHAAIWGRLLRLPMTFFNRHSVGDLSSRANIFDDLQAIWTSSTANAISSSLSMVFNLGLLFYYSWRLAFIIVALFLLLFLFTYLICHKVLPLITSIFDYQGKIDGLIFQLLNGIAKLRVAAKENTALALWSNLYNKVTVQNRKYMLTNCMIQIVANVLPLAGSIIIFSFIYFGLLKEGYQSDFGLGDFILFNTAFGQLTATVTSLSLVLISVVSTIPMANRMKPILQEPVEVSAQKPPLTSLRGNVRFSSVEFYYQPDIPILKDVSLEIDEGEYVAIVGRSGSGKSTLFKLLLGFEQPRKGAVFMDGTNINDIDISDLRQRTGVVLQNGDILPGSIYENIACENINVTLDAAWAAAEKAGLKEDIESLPMGMHTLLSAFGGGGLSGGQLQRVMITRSIAHNPAILLLDEATSALDNVTQKIVQNSLMEMNITRIVIAHRLSTISNVDRIYVLEQGEITEQGGYEELLEKRGLFYELAIRQMQSG